MNFRKVLIGFSALLVILILFVVVIAPYLPIDLDFRESTYGYKLERAYPNLEFEAPLALMTANDTTNRIFVVEQTGKIHVFNDSAAVSSTEIFLDLSNTLINGGEAGLLGLAFHPNFETNGLFFVDYTVPNPLTTRISQFRISDNNPNEANISSEIILLEVEQPYGNHNAGTIVFGPDGYLYITFGDGGDGGDPHNHGQNLLTFLGTILKIDVDNTENGRNYAIPSDNPFVGHVGALPEIYAYGLRNPWKISWDYETDTLWAADVGQNKYEEINIIEKGGNYGWNIMEASDCYGSNSCDDTDLIYPVVEYGRELGKSITGGFVYRGLDEIDLFDKYIYGDYVTGRIWYIDALDPSADDPVLIMKQNISISSFGVDTDGEILVLDRLGQIYNIIED